MRSQDASTCYHVWVPDTTCLLHVPHESMLSAAVALPFYKQRNCGLDVCESFLDILIIEFTEMKSTVCIFWSVSWEEKEEFIPPGTCNMFDSTQQEEGVMEDIKGLKDWGTALNQVILPVLQKQKYVNHRATDLS